MLELSMKVIAGTLKGRTLKGTKQIRPVTSFIKEAIFNILQHVKWEDACVLDIFAGAGNFGIEAISRGAAKVVFVDVSLENKLAILENLNCVEWHGRVIKGDAREVIKKLFKKGEKFNIIFADPPFDHNLGNELMVLFEKFDILENDGVLVLRLRNKEVVNFSRIWVVDKKLYGDSAVYFIKKDTM